MISLGLDASTTTAGYCLVEDDKILDYGWLDLTKEETVRGKVFIIINFIKNHVRLADINNINLESALSGFAGGFNQTHSTKCHFRVCSGRNVCR